MVARPLPGLVRQVRGRHRQVLSVPFRYVGACIAPTQLSFKQQLRELIPKRHVRKCRTHDPHVTSSHRKIVIRTIAHERDQPLTLLVYSLDRLVTHNCLRSESLPQRVDRSGGAAV